MIVLSEAEGHEAVPRTALAEQRGYKPRPETADGSAVRVEALPALEWSMAVEPAAGPAADVPEQARRAWIHHAPVEQVLMLYRQARAAAEQVPAPWWLRALERGALPSRDAGFAVEDRVSALLSRRAGWVYVPWADVGEDGYWEFVPSEADAVDGEPAVPTTIVHTDRHAGWVDVLPMHRGPDPVPVAVAGADDLRVRFYEIEGW